MSLHDLSWYPTCVQSFSPVPFTVFELQGLKLNNDDDDDDDDDKKKKKKEEEEEEELQKRTFFNISYVPHANNMYLRHSYPVVVKDVDSH